MESANIAVPNHGTLYNHYYYGIWPCVFRRWGHGNSRQRHVDRQRTRADPTPGLAVLVSEPYPRRQGGRGRTKNLGNLQAVMRSLDGIVWGTRHVGRYTVFIVLLTPVY